MDCTKQQQPIISMETRKALYINFALCVLLVVNMYSYMCFVLYHCIDCLSLYAILTHTTQVNLHHLTLT